MMSGSRPSSRISSNGMSPTQTASCSMLVRASGASRAHGKFLEAISTRVVESDTSVSERDRLPYLGCVTFVDVGQHRRWSRGLGAGGQRHRHARAGNRVLSPGRWIRKNRSRITGTRTGRSKERLKRRPRLAVLALLRSEDSPRRSRRRLTRASRPASVWTPGEPHRTPQITLKTEPGVRPPVRWCSRESCPRGRRNDSRRPSRT